MEMVSGVTSNFRAHENMRANIALQSESGSIFKGKNIRDLKEDKDGLEQVSKSFEGIFVHMILKEMRSTVSSDGGIMPKSKEREFFEEMLDEKMANQMSATKTVGIAEAIQRTYGSRFSDDIKNNTKDLNIEA